MNSMQIQCFLEAGRRLNFTEAAAKLYITQPAISRNISQLEEEWGVTLFLRDNKRKDTVLTPAGRLLLEHVTAVCGQFQQVLQRAGELEQGRSGTLQIGLIDGERIDDSILKALDIFQAEYPQVHTSLRRGSYRMVLEWLEEGQLDCAVTLEVEVADKPWIDSRVLFQLESLLILTKSHPLASREDCSLLDFRDATFINVASKESPALHAMLEEECARAGFQPKVLLAPDVKSQLIQLELGKGVTIGSANNMYVHHQNITAIPLKDLRSLSMVLAWSRSSANPCVCKFLSVMGS